MFPLTYFAPSFFAPTYFPEHGGGSTPTANPDLIAAIVAQINASSTLLGLFTAAWNVQKPPSVSSTDAGSYITVAASGDRSVYRNADGEWREATVRIRAHGATGDAATFLADAISADTRVWLSLSFTGCFSIPATQTNRTAGSVKSRRTGEKGSWWDELTFTFRYHKGA